MSLNKHPGLYVSTISDIPRNYFPNLELFSSSGIEGIHFDVMDGIFVPRLGLHPELLRGIRESTELKIEVHIMLQNPANFIETFAQNGADRLIFHYESSDKMDWLIEKTKNIGVEVGIALRPETEIDSVNSYLSSIDTVLLMAIQPGIPKHPILPNTFERLEKLRTIRDLHSSRVRIGIDGGVTFDNLLRLASLGADYFVCGSGTIFSPNGSLTENLTILNRLVSKEITH